MKDKKVNRKNLLPFFYFTLVTVCVFWKYFAEGLLPIPSDLIVGIYHPWRDYIWAGYTAGVPFRNGLLADIVSIIYPWRIYAMEVIKSGHWPLWIPQSLCGHPLLANFQSAVFYPLNLLFSVFESKDAWSIYIAGQPFLAGIFCYWFLKNLKLSSVSSLIGATIFSLSGFSGVWLEYGIIGHSGLWLPLLLLAVDKIFYLKSKFWAVTGSLAMAVSIFGGYPQISLMILGLTVIYAFYRGTLASGNKQALMYVGLFLFTGILISGIQIVPGMELLKLSIRQTDQTVLYFNHYLSPLYNLVLLFAPDFFGNPATQNFWGSIPYNESANYVGVVGILLALITLIVRVKDKAAIFMQWVLIVGLLLVLSNPVSNFIFGRGLPFFSSTSAGRFNFLVDFSLAILAGYGMEWLITKKNHLKRIAMVVGFALFVICTEALIIFDPFGWFHQLLSVNYAVVKRNLFLPAALMSVSIVGIVCLAIKWKYKTIQKLISVALLMLILLDLLRFTGKYNSFSSPGFLYPNTGLTDYLKARNDLNRFNGLIPQSMNILYNLSSPEGYEPLMIKNYNEYGRQINGANYDQSVTGSRWIQASRENSPLLDISGAKYLLSWHYNPMTGWDPQTSKYPPDKYKLVYQYGKSQIYENLSVLPRIFIAYDFQIADKEKILPELMNPDFDFRNILLLEKNPTLAPKQLPSDKQVQINAVNYFTNPNKVNINVRAKEDGILFLSDNYFPGWKVKVDNIEKELFRADYSFRAVEVPKGDHKVEFYYRPTSFRIGAIMSVLGLVLLLAMIII